MSDSREIYQVNGKTFQAKIDLDKYYTPIDIAKYCIDKTYEIIGKENIIEVIEPSAGDGSFSLQIPNCIAIDIEPQHESIVKQDFFTFHLPYKKGRLIIGNPPFGRSGNLAMQFYKHSIQMAEYVAFILPASQYNNIYSCYEYDLIYSELINSSNFIHLSEQVKLTFNIYKRPMNGFNKRKKYKFEDFELYLIRRRKNNGRLYRDNEYDFRIGRYGASCGRILNKDEEYVDEVCIYIYNDDIREEFMNLFKDKKILNEYYMTSTPSLQLWQIYEFILKYIPNIK